jgi:hypothetical protein
LVGTSQQQIQRIETGKQSVRFDLAVKICSALDAPMELVFPSTKRALKKLATKGGKTMEEMLRDKEFEEEMERADVDMDPSVWSLKYRLRGDAEGILPISSREKNRLWGAVQRAEGFSDPFVVFDSEGMRVVLNLNHLTFCQFLFDPPNIIIPEKEVDGEEGEHVTVFMADSDKPLSFEVDADSWDEDELDDMGQFGHLIFMAEHSTYEDQDIFHFTDVDGEEAFFRAKDVAMMQIPLWVVEPDLLEAQEDEATGKAVDQCDESEESGRT